MKKNEPKIILNMTIENDELEEKIKIAMDEYTKNVVYKNLDGAIERIVEDRINRLLNGSNYDQYKKIQGMYLNDFVRSKTEKTITEIIEKHAKDILAKKLASLL